MASKSPDYVSDYEWHNYGQNLHAIVERFYTPSTVEEVQQIVRTAGEAGKKVRVTGDAHSWSPLCVTDDYLISTANLNKILDVCSNPPSITVQPGVTVGDTLKAYTRNNVVLPMNVDVPPITIGGAVSVGANGFSRKYGTYSQFVSEMDVVTGTGELRTIRRKEDNELWQAASLGLGLFGVITRIKLDLVPMFNVRVVNKKIDMEVALKELPKTFMEHDYCQYFWFPYNKQLQLQTSDVSQDPSEWTIADSIWKALTGWINSGASYIIHKMLTTMPHLTPEFTKLAFKFMGESDSVMKQSENVLLGDTIDHFYPSQNASVSFPIDPEMKTPVLAWSIMTTLIDELEVKGIYPANLEANMRLFGPNTGLLDTLPGAPANQLTCNIQITSFNNKEWVGFEKELMIRWLEQIPNSRPHWAKQYQNVPNISGIIHDVYGENINKFMTLRETIDPNNVFMNSFLTRLLDTEKK